MSSLKNRNDLLNTLSGEPNFEIYGLKYCKVAKHFPKMVMHKITAYQTHTKQALVNHSYIYNILYIYIIYYIYIYILYIYIIIKTIKFSFLYFTISSIFKFNGKTFCAVLQGVCVLRIRIGKAPQQIHYLNYCEWNSNGI